MPDYMLKNVDFDEAKQSQLPLVELLINLGYTYVSRAETSQQRSDDTTKFLLGNTARTALMRINNYEYDGKQVKFSELDVAKAVDELENTRLEGLLDTSKDIFHTVMPKIGGKTIEVYNDGRYESKSFRFIDFENIQNNDFQVTVEYKVTGKESIRCDVVCFVNGIPFAVIENKKSSVSVEKAIAQLRRYQTPEYAPKLFIYPQLLIASNTSEFLYGTTGTPAKFYASWREREDNIEQQDAELHDIIAKEIDKPTYVQILQDLNGYTNGRSQLLERTVSPQDRGAYSILRPERLLDIAKNFVFYDGMQKKVARYQQYFAIHKMLQRINEHESSANGQRKRRGGVVWHTQGSGKSLTMVLFVRALIEDPTIINPRVIIVTDRKDLDRQIKNTFNNAGLKKTVRQAVSGEDLMQLIRTKDSAVITTLVHKFQSASNKRADFIDSDENVFVLIDEAHRTQGGEANLEMLRTIPNACYIAFTGTPLLKDEKTRNKFGDFIDQYTIDDALTDKIVLPLIYEGRYVPLTQNEEQIDRRADRVSEDLSAKQRYALHKSVQRKAMAENPDRISEICHDIQKHFVARFQGKGLKAQIVAPSKFAALEMKKFFDIQGRIQTALVISDENGEIPEDDEHKQEIATYLKEIKANYTNLQKYEESVIESFTYDPSSVEILIVVDKLLTGFDAPCNTVLYLARELKDHNLLQAIARVNRLYENPDFPKTSGFIIDYSENAQNIDTAMQLFGNYDSSDIQHALIDVSDKINQLEQTYGQLSDVFNGVTRDDQALLEHLRDDPTRVQFGERVNQFITVFNECLSLKDFAEKFDRNTLNLYKNEAKKFQNLKKSAALQYGDHVDLRKYELQLLQILDENIKAGTAQILTDEIEITDRTKLNEAIESLGSDKSKAEAIAAQTERRINERREQDEALYDRFSKRIKEILQAMHDKKMADIEALRQLRLIDDEVEQKKDGDLPPKIIEQRGADILYRNLRASLPLDDMVEYETIILGLTKVVHQSATVDWWRSFETKRQMRSRLDDYLYDEVRVRLDVDVTYEQIEKLIETILTLAENNHSTFTS
jgi:type I restriction enzyme R subunit